MMTLSLLLMAYGQVSGGEVVYQEGFEKSEALGAYKQKAFSTEASAEIMPGGCLSQHGLLVKKVDSCGMYRLTRKISLSGKGGKWFRLEADLNTFYKGVYAEFFFQIKQCKGADKVGDYIYLSFDNGFTRKNSYGGKHKTPQTLGNWQRTENIFKLHPEADGIELNLIFNRGSQWVCVDNITLSDEGAVKPARNRRLVFSKAIDWPYARLKLDRLLPGAVYKVSAGYRHPVPDDKMDGLTPGSRKSPKVPPVDATGMGIAMRWRDLDGKFSDRQQLRELPDENGRKIYRLVMPPLAMGVDLELHNDDLIRFDHNQISAQARRWTDISVTLENFGEITADNEFWQWCYRKRPAELTPGIEPDVGDYEIEAVRASMQVRKAAQLEVKKVNGAVTFVLDGKPVPPMISSDIPVGGNPDNFSELAKTGGQFFITRYPYGGITTHGDWKGPGNVDFSDLDQVVYKTLAQAPDGYIIISLDSLYPPMWWYKENRDEIIQDQNGLYCFARNVHLYNSEYGQFDELYKRYSGKLPHKSMHALRGATWKGHFVPSRASEKWRSTMAEFLAMLRKHVDQSDYGKAVVGYRLAWGFDGQGGFVLDSISNPAKGEHYADFSKPMQKRFKAYLREKYGTVEKLRASWNDPQVTFQTAKLPPIEKRDQDQYKGNPYLIDPKKDGDLLDYRECEAVVTAECMNIFGKSLKEAGERKIVVLSYFHDLSQDSSGSAGKRLGADIVMREPWIDGYGGPVYEGRDIGLGGMRSSMLSSMTLHGKLSLTEIDHRLYSVLRRNYANNLVFETPKASLSVLQREMMSQMCSGYGSWTFDMGLGWFADPLIAKMVKQSRDVYRKVLPVDRSSIAKMACFFSEQGKNVQADARRGAVPRDIVCTAKLVLSQAGFPIDQYLMPDLKNVAGKYRVYCFPFAYGLTPDEAKAIESLKRDGNILVFGYAAGYVVGSRDIRNVQRLTGMKLGLDSELPLTMQISKIKHPPVAAMSGFCGSGSDTGQQMGLPGIFVDDNKAVTLAKFCNTGKTAFAVKDHGSWTSIYYGVPGNIVPGFFRGIASFAKLPIYNKQGDVMYFNRSLVGIHASSNGKKIINLPENTEVVSLWDNVRLGRLKRIVRDMKTGENALYLLGNPGKDNSQN